MHRGLGSTRRHLSRAEVVVGVFSRGPPRLLRVAQTSICVRTVGVALRLCQNGRSANPTRVGVGDARRKLSADNSGLATPSRRSAAVRHRLARSPQGTLRHSMAGPGKSTGNPARVGVGDARRKLSADNSSPAAPSRRNAAIHNRLAGLMVRGMEKAGKWWC